MNVIISYDVDKQKCNKVMKILRRYMFHIQNSLFQGELTIHQIQKIKQELNKILNEDDNVIMYFTYNHKHLNKEVIFGKDKYSSSNII